ncbi:MAG: hypothetical protein WCS73_06295 [Lentisphaeria bacterium]
MTNYWFRTGSETQAPYVAVFRNHFILKKSSRFKLSFSADERCQLFLNGKRIIDGPERGDIYHWYLQNYETNLPAGEYCLVARVLCFGQKITAYGQQSIQHGLYAKSALLNDHWEYQLLKDCKFKASFPDWGTFPSCEISSGYNWDILKGRGGEWKLAEKYLDPRTLHPPDLPLMRYEPETNYQIIRQPNKLLVIFNDYVCVWPEFVFFGSGTVRIRWAETLYEDENYDSLHLKGMKGNRNEFVDKHFIGEGNLFELAEGKKCQWVDYWWKAGRYLKIDFDGDCQVEQMNFFNTGYPYQCKIDLKNPDPRVEGLLKMSYRTLQSCSYETYMDCPYYEQLMYIGDTRIEALCTYMITDDRRLVKKALRTLARSQRPDGMISSQWPTKGKQEIPSFALLYILMLHDFIQWNDDTQVIRELLPVGRRIIAYFCRYLNAENLLEQVPGWNFIDWVEGWQNGVPPKCENGSGCSLNWFFVLALQSIAKLEKHFNNLESSKEYSDMALKSEKSIRQIYYNPDSRLFAEDKEQQNYSEHAQILALLATDCTEVISGLRSGMLNQCGIYFSFYYQEACLRHGFDQLFEKRLEKYYALLDTGLKTIPEEFENPRSDCHAWGAYPLYHYASILKNKVRFPCYNFKGR